MLNIVFVSKFILVSVDKILIKVFRVDCRKGEKEEFSKMT